MEIIVINVAADLSLRYGKVGAFEDDTLFVVVVWALIHEWEVIDNLIVHRSSVEWRVVVTTNECNIAFDVAIVEIELAILF